MPRIGPAHCVPPPTRALNSRGRGKPRGGPPVRAGRFPAEKVHDQGNDGQDPAADVSFAGLSVRSIRLARWSTGLGVV